MSRDVVITKPNGEKLAVGWVPEVDEVKKLSAEVILIELEAAFSERPKRPTRLAARTSRAASPSS